MGITRRESIAPYQERLNGPLEASIRARMNRLREQRGFTMDKLGRALGFSGPFISTLLREDGPASIRTKHMTVFHEKLVKLELQEGMIGKTPVLEEDTASLETGKDEADLDGMTLEHHVAAINARGYAVTLWRVAKEPIS